MSLQIQTDQITFRYIKKNLLNLVHDINVKTLTANKYSDIIDFNDEHCKQMRKIAKPTENEVFAHRNLNLWIEIMHKSNLLKQAKIQ